MTTSERIGWLLAMFLCVIFPLALGYYVLALAGAGGLGGWPGGSSPTVGKALDRPYYGQHISTVEHGPIRRSRGRVKRKP